MIQPCPHRQLLCAPKPFRPRFSPLLLQFLTEPSPWKLPMPLSNPVEPNYSLQLTKFKPSRALSSYPNHSTSASPPIQAIASSQPMLCSIHSSGPSPRARDLTDTGISQPSHLVPPL
ncbi:hypothetical protein M0R45_025087 [Rubus argutus]|uniref:Uncharacterized protein n=1 Tax=Rubus argutus TaxID=59490 RepID=A0AAW1WW32_RUBAR